MAKVFQNYADDDILDNYLGPMIINAKTKAFATSRSGDAFWFYCDIGQTHRFIGLGFSLVESLITAASLFIFLRLRGRKIILDSKRIKIYMAISGVIAIHWLTFWEGSEVEQLFHHSYFVWQQLRFYLFYQTVFSKALGEN
ncbi:MAG: hypothetical protein IPL23_04050 [Saprospiraceae bacterium]|nr:hypothetical protein [Saprospiraceae bacterium]